MLAYMIQCHKDLRSVAQLIGWIYHPEDLYFVQLDASSDDNEEFKAFRSGFENIIFSNRCPCVWGGTSIVSSTIDAITHLLQNTKKWEYFINISGDDFPLQTRQEIIDTLRLPNGERRSVYLADFGTCEFDPCTDNTKNIVNSKVINFRDDLKIKTYGTAFRNFNDLDASPIRQPGKRSSLSVFEDVSAKELHIRPLQDPEVAFRASFFSETPFRFGRQWIVASREFCEFVAYSDDSARLYNCLSTCFIPDESFFQMCATLNNDIWSRAVIDNNLRYQLGGPQLLSDVNFDELKISRAFFARKLYHSGSKAIISRLWQKSNFLFGRFQEVYSSSGS